MHNRYARCSVCWRNKEATQDYIESMIDHVTVAREAQWAAVEGSLKIERLSMGSENAIGRQL